MKIEASHRRITAPQIVFGGGITTEIVLDNTASIDCNSLVTYHKGAGQFPDDPVLTNGQNLGNTFTQDIPAQGTRLLKVLGLGTGLSIGAVSLDILNPACFDSVHVQTQYSIFGQGGQLNELFSYPTPIPVPLNSCASAPVNFDPDPSDGQTNIPGLANVSLDPLNNVERTMQLFDSQGNHLATRPAESFGGQHRTRLLTEFFPLQPSFSGSWRVCFMGQQDPTALHPTVIDTLFIDVVQSGDNFFQFDSNNHSLVNPGCLPDNRTLCLNDGRFKVQTEWSSLSQIDQPGLVQDVKPDGTGFFFFSNSGNTELLIKVLDGCGFNNNFWVFYAATTDVEFTVTVTDTQTNATKEYSNPLGTASPAVTDTGVFATCP